MAVMGNARRHPADAVVEFPEVGDAAERRWILIVEGGCGEVSKKTKT